MPVPTWRLRSPLTGNAARPRSYVCRTSFSVWCKAHGVLLREYLRRGRLDNNKRNGRRERESSRWRFSQDGAVRRNAFFAHRETVRSEQRVIGDSPFRLGKNPALPRARSAASVSLECSVAAWDGAG